MDARGEVGRWPVATSVGAEHTHGGVLAGAWACTCSGANKADAATAAAARPAAAMAIKERCRGFIMGVSAKRSTPGGVDTGRTSLRHPMAVPPPTPQRPPAGPTPQASRKRHNGWATIRG